MRPIVWRWLAVSSLLAASLAACAETRPNYGGTLHIMMRGAPASLDPAAAVENDSFAQRGVTLLIFETLIASDDGGRLRAVLASSWQTTPDNKRWQFHLRRGIRFDDGTNLTPDIAAASLRAANPAWKVTTDADSVVIECETPDANLAAELAMPHYAIAKRDSDRPRGTGPFRAVDWQPGKKLTLAANEDCWRGRPFLDGIEIEMGKSFRDQWSAFELRHADLVEVAPEQAHRISLEGRRLLNSAPVELIALVFARDTQTPQEKSLREALALSVDRASIRSVLLQSAGQSSGGILPNWMSGYGFVFSPDADLARARHEREQVRTVPSWTLGYDNGDSLSRLLAERIALNARDAGLSVQPTSAPNTDLRLMRIPLDSVNPWIALGEVSVLAGVSLIKESNAGANTGKAGSIDDLYTAERELLATQRVIPLFHLPVSCAATAALNSWSVNADGTLNLADAWIGSAKP